VDGLWHRRLHAESAFAFPEQAARFPPESYKPVQNLLSRMKWMRLFSCAMDACLRIQSVPKGQHEVCVTKDHPRRPIIPGRIRHAGMRMAGHRGCFRYRSMTSGRFFLAATIAIFRTHHRPCERRSRCENCEKRQSNRLDLHCGQPRRPGYVVRDAVFGHFLSRHRHQKDWRRCRGDLMRNRSIPVFSFNHVGALYRSTIHSVMHSIRRYDQLKKRPSQGWRLGRFGGFAGQTARRICVLSGATLPPIARPTMSYRYSRIPTLPAFLETR
jgi:hypothetical protein